MTAQGKIAPAFDAVAARADFPILSRTVYGKPLAYLDSGASAQKPRVVLDAMRVFTETEYANVHRGVHYLSGTATDKYEAARRTVQKFLGAAREDEIVFTKGGHRGDQSGLLQLPGPPHPAGRRDRAVGDGASFQHRALALPARAPWRGAALGGYRR